MNKVLIIYVEKLKIIKTFVCHKKIFFTKGNKYDIITINNTNTRISPGKWPGSFYLLPLLADYEV